MDDLINRQAAIKAIDEIESEVVDGDGFQYKKWRQYFYDLPSAEPEQRWIPCSERLPDFGIPVLLNERFSYAVGYLLKTTEGKYEWGVNGWYNDLEDWSAWMPLPIPWKGENDG